MPSYFAGSVGAGARAGGEVREHREREEAVGDRAAERRGRGALRVHVDELVVVGDVGELVHLLLGDLEPLAGALVVADVGLEQGECLLGCFAHAAHCRRTRRCRVDRRRRVGTTSDRDLDPRARLPARTPRAGSSDQSGAGCDSRCLGSATRSATSNPLTQA